MTSNLKIGLGLALLITGAIGLTACSGLRAILPASQGNIDDVRADQEISAQAAEDGNTLRTALSGLSALAGSILVSMGLVRRKDNQPFSGVVNGRTVTATEDELVSVVEAVREGGKRPSA